MQSVIGKKRKRKATTVKEMCVGFEQTMAEDEGGGGMEFAEWEKVELSDRTWDLGDAERAEIGDDGGRADSDNYEDDEPDFDVGRGAELEWERARRVDERWRYDDGGGPVGERRGFLLDDYKPRFVFPPF